MELISKESAIDAAMQDVSCIRTHEFNAGATRAANRIKQLPSIELKTGEWIKFSEHGTCPYCGNCVDLVGGKENNFCSECGADLRGK